ncbi:MULTISPECIES: type II toxin-antitoxin system HicA family toxin [Bifidobacterium]|jgi:predicted RNA binding protein YcfA (HicA-like mRNA interferase family)|uniref:Type II toxin-antitoxin system HicA family toxin n=1 Tax=Bifidobacterium tibiigranuli TaxID=2172043 RepID=A0A5N6RWW7_9BIFI|nr:type II toxin-antitoxin system HicA family toxin [Bifidobacterium tibiigranuli]KAE8126326.1 type II toxin-antitoxin system HicA family toxin [Bifidobacterium tibiigranuli]KAE8126397.1 type II toxin-antitoxin system HicA family toxin [Bifidobacterium tibiigranuli]MCH3975267.1 type II toxin-antitoxin system HicA family toxin [Bifidobacterium tibiigranuli]MCH4190296.1 type II toxin-antitoxin system HicA family toxin [Bifidobacterium tibiigranuli]MCH4203465.1 type II toxin-antitoxin system HicA
MTKPMKYRDLIRLLERAGFSSRQGKGDHEVWSNGSISITITQSREISPGLTRKVLQAIERSKR